MFSVDSHLMPRCRPENAEATNAAEKGGDDQEFGGPCGPDARREVEPFRALKCDRAKAGGGAEDGGDTASRSVTFPGRASARSVPMRGMNAALRRLPRPLRKPA